ncbi:MAG: hypothetical protein HYS12_00535 [Planctomycetes bacterium]|nr:hypothetical protein [Planctomycetota bacterium]
MYRYTHSRPTRSRGCLAGWAFVFAAGLAVTPAAAARPSPLRRVQWAEQSAPQAAPGMSAEARKLEEVRVKLAWLGNPATFRYHLGAHAEEGTMRLTGYVPCQPLKQRAAEIAGKATTLQVVDEIQVHEGMSFLFPDHRPLDVLYREAIEVLSQEFGERGARLTVTARPDGQLTVSGAVMPREEQLAVAESLRRVAGCSCVVSKLDAPDRGAASAVVHPEEVLPIPRQPSPFAGAAAPAMSPKAAPLPMRSHFVPPVSPPVSGTILPSPPALPSAPVSASPPPLPPLAEPIQKRVNPPLPATPTATTQWIPPLSGPMPAPPMRDKKLPVEFDPFKDTSRPTIVRPSQQPSGIRVEPAPKWEPVPVPVAPVVPAVAPPRARSSLVQGVASPGVARKSVPAPMKSGSYVSAGMVSFENEPSSRPAKIETRVSSPEEIQRAVVATGGAALRRVLVQPLPGGKFDLDVALCNADGWEQVLERLKALPELNGLQVNWNVTLAP